MEDNANVTILEDYGAFGDGRRQKHLTKVSWFGKEPVYDLRAWNSDMTECSKGITLSKEDLYDLYNIIESVLGISKDDDLDEDEEYE